MNCKYCGSPMEADARFCVQCGKTVKPQQSKQSGTYCQICGEPMGTQSSFCLKCGAAVQKQEPRRQQQQQTARMSQTFMPEAAGTLCPNCGAAMQPGDVFCVMCGADFSAPVAAAAPAAGRKKNNRVLVVVLVCLLLLVIGICAFIGYEMISGSRDEDDTGKTEEDKHIGETVTERPAPQEDEETRTDTEEGKKLSVTVLHEDGTAEYCELETEEDKLVAAMEQEDIAQFAVVDGSMAAVSVLDEQADRERGESWVVYRNGSEVGYVDACMIEDGDEIKFVFRVEEEQEQPDEEQTMSSEYLLPESNSRYLTLDDIDHLDHEHLCFARNEIYARHGWIFSVPQIANYFATKSWYVGTTLPANFNYGVLNAYEQANIKLIVDYEAQFGGSYYP